MAESAAWFPFYRNWYDHYKLLHGKSRAEFIDAILTMAFSDEAPSASSFAASTAINMCGPVIRKSVARQAAGRAGGTTRQANAKQTPSKRQANAKQTPSIPFIKGKGKGKGNDISPSTPPNGEKKKPPTFEEVCAYATPTNNVKPMPDAEWLRGWYDEMSADGWRSSMNGGRDLLINGEWRRILRSSWRNDCEKALRGEVRHYGNFENELKKNNFGARVATATADVIGAEGAAAAMADFIPGGAE